VLRGRAPSLGYYCLGFGGCMAHMVGFRWMPSCMSIGYFFVNLLVLNWRCLGNTVHLLSCGFAILFFS